MQRAVLQVAAQVSHARRISRIAQTGAEDRQARGAGIPLELAPDRLLKGADLRDPRGAAGEVVLIEPLKALHGGTRVLQQPVDMGCAAVAGAALRRLEDEIEPDAGGGQFIHPPVHRLHPSIVGAHGAGISHVPDAECQQPGFDDRLPAGPVGRLEVADVQVEPDGLREGVSASGGDTDSGRIAGVSPGLDRRARGAGRDETEQRPDRALRGTAWVVGASLVRWVGRPEGSVTPVSGGIALPRRGHGFPAPIPDPLIPDPWSLISNNALRPHADRSRVSRRDRLRDHRLQSGRELHP